MSGLWIFITLTNVLPVVQAEKFQTNDHFCLADLYRVPIIHPSLSVETLNRVACKNGRKYLLVLHSNLAFHPGNIKSSGRDYVHNTSNTITLEKKQSGEKNNLFLHFTLMYLHSGHYTN